jgi:hypothetical protein
VTDALESELDVLFQLSPHEMVDARNALAARLKKAGERDASLRVKSLKRPAPAAWAINQVFFCERELLEAARLQVVQMRELQATDGIDRQQLAAAATAQRATLQAIVDAALRHCAAAGVATGAMQERRVFTTMQGWLAGNGAEAPGRMTRELEPSGFEAIGLLGTPAALPTLPPPLAATHAEPGQQRKPATVSAPALTRLRPTPEPVPTVPSTEELARRARELAGARVIEHKQYVEWAHEREAEQRKKQALAEHEVDRAKRELDDAERALAERRARLAEREAALVSKRAEVDDAERARCAAETALARARAELAKLEAALP